MRTVPTWMSPLMSEASIASHERVSVAGAVGAGAASTATATEPPLSATPTVSVPTFSVRWSSATVRSDALWSSWAPTVTSTTLFVTLNPADPLTRPAMSSESRWPETSSLSPASVRPEPGTVDQSSAVAFTGALAVPAPSAS